MDENEERQEYRREIKNLLEKAGLTQVKLAAMASIDPATLSRFLSAKQDLKQSTRNKIEEALSDVLEGQRMTKRLQVQRFAARTMPLREAPAGRYVTQPERELELELQNARLAEINARLTKQVRILEGMVEQLQRVADLSEEASTLAMEALEQYWKQGLPKLKETDALLKRAAALTKK